MAHSSTPTMENLYYEVALEYLFKMPYAEILRGTEGGGATEMDLLRMGHRLYLDLVRLQRKEISRIVVPPRFPRAGEYSAI